MEEDIRVIQIGFWSIIKTGMRALNNILYLHARIFITVTRANILFFCTVFVRLNNEFKKIEGKFQHESRCYKNNAYTARVSLVLDSSYFYVIAWDALSSYDTRTRVWGTCYAHFNFELSKVT